MFEKGHYLDLTEYPIILTSPAIFSIKHLIVLGVLLFIIGFLGIVFNKNNALTLFMSIEIMLLGASLVIIAFGIFFKIPQSFIFALLVLSVAAAESAIGLSI